MRRPAPRRPMARATSAVVALFVLAACQSRGDVTGPAAPEQSVEEVAPTAAEYSAGEGSARADSIAASAPADACASPAAGAEAPRVQPCGAAADQ